MNSVSYPNFRSWQADNRTVESMGIYSGASYNLAVGDGADYVQGATVSWTMFHVLGRGGRFELPRPHSERSLRFLSPLPFDRSRTVSGIVSYGAPLCYSPAADLC